MPNAVFFANFGGLVGVFSWLFEEYARGGRETRFLKGITRYGKATDIRR